jgi:NADH-quinone oxidoreductase subunit J
MSWGFAIWAGLLALLSAGLAVTRPSIVHGLMLLIASLLCLAAAFFALAAGFAGAIQILIYAGAITAVFVFVVMTVDSGEGTLSLERAQLGRAWRAPAVVLALALLPLLIGLGVETTAPITPGDTGVRALGLLLFGPWAVTVELVSLMLLAGVIGVRHLGRSRSPAQDDTGVRQ